MKDIGLYQKMQMIFSKRINFIHIDKSQLTSQLILMGNYLSKNEEEISDSLKQEYEISAQPFLLHKKTNQLCTLHKLTANSAADSSRIRQVVEEYQRTKCQSISKLRTHYHLDHTGYCSDQQNFYLVFDGQNNYTLRQEFVKRRLYRTPFSHQEIQQVIQTFLCGLREYDHRFQRDYSRLSLDSITIDQQSKRIYLKDPWLASHKSGDHTDALSYLLLDYPSPEKLKAAFSSKMEDYKEFLSSLFSVGVMALQLNRLEFADGIYIHKREVNYEEIQARLRQFQNDRLRRGIQCLLDPTPSGRKRIYQIWGIQNKEEHYLQPILANKQEETSPLLNIPPKVVHSPVRAPKFQFPPAPSLQPVPPLTFRDNMRASNPLSTRSDPPQPLLTVPQIFAPPRTQEKPIIFNFHPSQMAREPQFAQPYPAPTSLPKIHFADTKSVDSNPRAETKAQNVSTLFIPQPISSQRSVGFNEIFTREMKINSQTHHSLPRFQNQNRPNISRNQPYITQRYTAPNISAQSNGWSFHPLAEFKESIEETQHKQSIEAFRSHSLQTRFQSPLKQREIKSILLQERQENAVVMDRAPSIIDKLCVQKELPKTQEITLSHETQHEGLDSYLIKNNQQHNDPIVLIDNNESIGVALKEYKKDPFSETPQRPTSKNKYNSTIVQVKDEDSPEHSAKSDEVLEQEYVVEEYETGSRYEGFKSSSMRNGRGKFYYQDGGYYQGQWKNNKMDGFGRLYYEGGKLAYEGNWSQDQFNGLGKVYNDNPAVFDSPFDYTNFQLLQDYWEYYEGMLIHDTKEGRGKIKLSNGELFQGDFHNDRIQGFGKFHNREGKTIEGIWRESKLIKIINTAAG